VPANLTPQYYEAEKRFRAAKEIDEKIAALQDMLAVMPRHKGTDHLYGSLRSKIAKLTQESERKLATARRAGFLIRREGAGQVILVGPANAGKSQLLAMLTAASPEIALYPYTTQAPIPGMMSFEDIQIQLVDTPPIGQRNVKSLITNILRVADLIAIVVDLSGDPVADIETTLMELEECRIVPAGMPTEKEGDGIHAQRMVIIANKCDLPGATKNLPALERRFGGVFPIFPVSAEELTGLEELPGQLFEVLELIRVYTKAPGQKADLGDPVILTRNSTVGDAAAELHKDFKQGLKHAVVWGSGKFDAQTVSKSHVLADGDIVEFHM
jgi:ribosome-interacting GTPase 1